MEACHYLNTRESEVSRNPLSLASPRSKDSGVVYPCRFLRMQPPYHMLRIGKLAARFWPGDGVSQTYVHHFNHTISTPSISFKDSCCNSYATTITNNAVQPYVLPDAAPFVFLVCFSPNSKSCGHTLLHVRESKWRPAVASGAEG